VQFFIIGRKRGLTEARLSLFDQKQKESCMSYNQLTLLKRYHISALLKIGLSQKEIAKEIGVHPSTISRELKRNSDKRGYDAEKAQIETTLRHKHKKKHTVWSPSTERYVREKLKLDWSPEQISGRMKQEGRKTVSHETIYRYIYANKTNGGILYRHLRYKNRKYHKRGRSYDSRGILKNRTMIDKRPKIVESKQRIGDWEIDTVIGKNYQGALVTVVDRHSKFTLIAPTPSKHASVVSEALLRLLEPIKNITKTITSDNGKEFAEHETISKKLGAKFYFANPYHSWERGLNEHTNGLIRQYLSKDSEFKDISNKEVAMIQNRLNHRPRKILGYKTPYEVFFSKFLKELNRISIA